MNKNTTSGEKMKFLKKITLLTFMIPAMALAQETCITDIFGNCINPPIGGGPGGGGSQVVWTGYWYDQNLTLHSVSASTFAACNTLLMNAVAGQTVILGRCQRTN